MSLLRLAGRSHLLRGDADRALACADERLDLVRGLDDPYELAWALHDRGVARRAAGDEEGAEADFREAVATLDTHGVDLSVVRASVAVMAAVRGDLVTAEAQMATALRGAETRGRAAWGAASLATVKILLGRLDEASELIGVALPTLWARRSSGVGLCVESLAAIAVERGDASRAARLLGTATELDRAAGIVVRNRDAHELELRERTESRAREALGAERFAAAQREGRGLAARFEPALVLGDD
jgi:non-specific serine/threonine protein kinase